MVRLLAVSGGIMMVGLMTVLIAIVYRLNARRRARCRFGRARGRHRARKCHVSATSADETGMTLTLTLENGGTEIRRFDTAGRLIGRYVVVGE